MYDYVKALHIIFVVTWFAGLFYMVRLLIYHTEASKKDEPDRSILTKQYALMEKRLWYGIATPSKILTLVFGVWMLVLNHDLLSQGWMHIKFAFLIGLFAYDGITGSMARKIRNGVYKNSSFKLRIWNEVATLFLVSIVFVVVLKSSLDWVWGVVGLVVFAVVLMLAIKMYRKIRLKKAEESA